MSEFYKRQFQLAPLQQVSPIGLQESARTAQQASQSLDNSGANLYQMGAEIYAKEIEVQARQQLRDIYNNNQSNPAAFKKQADILGKELLKKSALPSVRSVGVDVYNQLADGYMDKVQSNHIANVTNQQTFVTLQAIDQRMIDMSEEAKNAFGPDGRTNPKSLGRVMTNMQMVDSEMSRAGPDGRYLFSPQQRYAMLEASKFGMYQSIVDGLSKNGNPIEVWKKWENDEMQFDIEVDGQINKIDIKKGLTPELQKKVGDYIQGKTREYYSILNGQASFDEKQRKAEAENKSKDAIDLAAKGGLTVEFVNQNRNVFDSKQYEKFTTRALEGGPPVTDRLASLEVNRLIAQNRTDEAYDYLKNNVDKFTNEDINRYQTLSLERGSVASGRRDLLKALGEGIEGLPASAPELQYKAQIEYDERVNMLRSKRNPDGTSYEPTVQDVRQINAELIDRYRPIALDNISIVIPRPSLMTQEEKQSVSILPPERFENLKNETLRKFAVDSGLTDQELQNMTADELNEFIANNPLLSIELSNIEKLRKINRSNSVNNQTRGR